MATEKQRNYIADLTVVKTKEFKEVKELIAAAGIVSDQAELVKNAQSIAEITNVMTDLQASKLIDALIAAKEPARGNAYSKRRYEEASNAVDRIKSTINNWDFE